MADVEKRRPSAGPVIGMVVVILVILGLGFWFLARDRDNTADKGLTDAGDSLKLSGVIYDSTAAGPTGRTTRGVGAGLTAAEAPLFEGRDIHDVPLGVILDYAQRLTYDEARGHELTLARNSRGQAARVRIWPEGGASSQEGSTLKLGRIVARIESDGAYEDLGLADGLNYLWVEGQGDGGFSGVIIPATAFAPLHDLERVSITERTPSGVPLEKGAYWVDGKPWIACGRC